jgi:histone H3/H4
MNKTEVKELIKKQNLRISKDCFERIETKVNNMIMDAIARTKANKRLTVQPYDF